MKDFEAMRDGLRIFGKIAFPEGSGPFPVAVFSHGFGASRVYDGEMGSAFVERGIAFAAFDFCGGGPESQSDGSMLDMSVLTEMADLRAVIDVVCAMDEVDSERVFLVGGSQGGYVSACVAAERPSDIRALVLFFPAFCIGDDAALRMAAWSAADAEDCPEEVQVGRHVVGRRYIQDALAVDVFERIGGYDGDVLIVHGACDGIVPPRYSECATDVYGDRARLVLIDDMGHGFCTAMPEQRDRALGLALDFIAAAS